MAGLFNFLRGTAKSKARGSAPRMGVPDGTRVYAIGDIHGRADLLARLLDMIGDDAEAADPARRVLICLGDYIDRGLESRQVIDMLLDKPFEGFETVFLRGNHEQALLDFLGDKSFGPSWFAFGGDATLYSYDVRYAADLDRRERLDVAHRDFTQRLPPRHLAFLQALPYCHVEGDYFFVHAGIQPGTPLDRQTAKDMLWIRDPFLDSTADHGKIIVHGHTILTDVTEPDIRANRIGIDTGAYDSGRLTALVVEGDRRRFLQT